MELRMPDKPSKRNLALEVLICTLAAIPLIALIVYVNRYGVDLPFLDQWEFIPVLEKFYQGHLTFSDLWQQHNEHRIFFPRIVFLVLARMTHWNIRYEMAANIIVAAGIFLAIAYQIRKTSRATGSRYLMWTVPAVSVITFSLMQWENWLWGWELQIFMNLLAVVMGIILLSSRPFKWSRLAWSMLLGILATYSFANGSLYWPIGLILLIISGPTSRQPRVMALSAWAVVGTLTMGSYLYHYHTPADHPSLLFVFQKPLVFLEYVLLYLGEPCAGAGGHVLTVIAGAVGLVLAIAVACMLVKRQKVDRHVLTPYIGLALYAVGSALMTGFARAGLGLWQALATRYIAISSLLWIANVVFLCLLAERMTGNRWRLVPAAIALAIVLFAGIISATSVHLGADLHDVLSDLRINLLLLKDADDFRSESSYIKIVYSGRTLAKSRLDFLKEHHLSLYRTNSRISDQF